ncbi:hypothetical protein OsJ_25393 [Oryza sativa Japonica Group]|uniref:Uncharacterized protein n=1 Tax=Oryza sativa subsp. japonica TaxID=39947 RepID=B9FUL0_ORYSJ|nr:hypothetical protein OsJ_25393 [Oryza sativa Japonica Group]
MALIGRVTMVNAVLSSIPIYLLMAINVPKWVIKGIDKIQGSSIRTLAPAVHAAVAARTRNRRTVRKALQGRTWIRDISGAFEIQAILEYLSLWTSLQSLDALTEEPDSIIWRWESSGEYSAHSAYQSISDVDCLLPKVDGQALVMLSSENPHNCFIMILIHDDKYIYVAASLLHNMCLHVQHELTESDLKELSHTLREVLERIMDAEGAELEILNGLS